jgi:hypothetical protein
VSAFWPEDETVTSSALDSVEKKASAGPTNQAEPVTEDPAPVSEDSAPADAEPERDTSPADLVPEDTFTSYKPVNGSVAVSNAYYNEQMAVHGHPSNWAASCGLRFVNATQRDGYVLLTCTEGDTP